MMMEKYLPTLQPSPAREGAALAARRKSGRAIALLLALLALGGLPHARAAKETEPGPDSGLQNTDPIAVKVTTQREGTATHFFVVNQDLCEVTMTFDMSLENMTSDQPFPCTKTLAPGKTTEVFTLTPTDPKSKWQYDYTNYFRLGSAGAQHDDRYVYLLPYSPGDKFKVTQGYNGSFSHRGSNKYAIDWKMPQGTLVRAARGGLVVRVKDSSSLGGGSLKFDPYNNYILIRHDDGTLGQYCHLAKDGALITEGQVVAAGDAIAHSGSTGFSSGPHLHFCVFENKTGRERVSIPVKYRTASDNAVTLIEGHTYRAAEILPNITAKNDKTPAPSALLLSN
jgi:murein DD-endopeptidase MepM/ murein hydrolase activator NlpD